MLQVVTILGVDRKPYSGILERWSDLPLMDQTGVMKSHILCFWLLSPLLLFLQPLNILGGNRKSFQWNLESLSDFVFLVFISFIVAFELSNVLRVDSKSLSGSLESLSYLPPGPPLWVTLWS